MRWIGLAISAMGIVTIAGCASRGEIETMKAQLEYIERSTVQMQDRLVQLDSMYRETIDKNVSYQADLKTALSTLIDKSSSIDNRLSDMEDRLNTIVNRPSRGGQTGTDQPPVGGVTPSDTGKAGLPQVDPKKLFDNAYADMTSKNYDFAIMEFGEFVAQFKDDPMAGDAQFWLGECYYGKREYAKAAAEFDKVVKNYPKSDKMVTAVFKAGRSYEELGDKKKARASFQRIVTEFPKSIEANMAQERLKGL